MLARLHRTINDHKHARLKHIPGPTPRFPFGTAPAFFGRWPWELCAEYGHRYGGITLVWLFNKPAVVLNDPHLIGEVLDTRAAEFYKGAPVDALKPVITRPSLFITNFGRGWEEARRDNPLSTIPLDEWLSRQVEPLRAVVAETVGRWAGRSHEPVDLYWDVQRLVFDVFARAFWGRVFPPNRFHWFRTLARTGTGRMALPKQVFPLHPFFHSARENWYGTFTRAVAEARANPDPAAPDLLNCVLARGTSLSDAALAEALATNFFGGVFSCSSTVNTTLYLLAKHAEEGAKVARAVRDELPDGFDRAALDAVRPLEFAIRESMRYYPAVPIYFRNTARGREVKLGSHVLPPDTLIFISNWYLHKFAPHWAEPERFAPERWDNGGAEANPYGSGHFFPFGRGPRACVGAAFGQFVHRLVLATIYRESEPDVDVSRPYQQSFFFAVMMPKGMRARFRPRAPVTAS
ncbi:cytochrome P450 [Gemmata sp. G18]|uniref:Cytochrome P450 n=1 Tax=Gemmata palustris TaxID=2822762 RepID=A0ABS5BN90_9BACT|nr:cytochrome P450 [Gemmata palustris]MBP3955177.1 cytochrome P450 [Gemmata palustris]